MLAVSSITMRLIGFAVLHYLAVLKETMMENMMLLDSV